MLRQTQQQKLLQRLSPQQIQLMKLLQVPTANLEERIKDELEGNPALDLGSNTSSTEDTYDSDHSSSDHEESYGNEDLDLSSYLQHENEGSSLNEYNYYNSDDDDDDKTIPIKIESTFHDHLNEQLSLVQMSDADRIIAEQVIGSIDDDGYLRRDVMNITDDLAFKQGISTTDEEVEKIIAIIQDFDPPGVCARDLKECLLLQLYRLEPKVHVKYAITILEQYFEEFTKKHFDKIKTRTKLSDEDFKEAINVIIKLTPKPGGAYTTSNSGNNYIIPDFFVTNNNGKLELTLNARNAPDLRISEGYKEMFETYNNSSQKNKREKEAVMFIKQKIDAAKWFIDAIKQRQQTLLFTMNAIMLYQQEFFLTGNESDLKPMILKDIADATNMDISTVSRVANSKYVQTEYGTFILKYFFSEAIISESGEEVSIKEVKNILLKLVAEENKAKPYSDEKLMEMLNKEGYNVARRTIAKYREQLDIPVARLRKEA